MLYYRPTVVLEARLLGLSSLQDIYMRWWRTRAAKIFKDPINPNNRLFQWLRSGKRLHNHMARTERLRKSFFAQAIRTLNSWSVLQLLTHTHTAPGHICTCTGHFSIYTYVRTYIDTVSMIICDVHHIHPHQAIQWAQVPCGWGGVRLEKTTPKGQKCFIIGFRQWLVPLSKLYIWAHTNVINTTRSIFCVQSVIW